MGSAIQGNIIYISILLLFYYREGWLGRQDGRSSPILHQSESDDDEEGSDNSARPEADDVGERPRKGEEM